MILFGEGTKQERHDLGEHHCAVCAKTRTFAHIQERNYFCLFGLRLLPLEETANYQTCDFCENAFALGDLNDQSVPSQVSVIHATIAYVLVGYGMQEHAELAQDISRKVTGFELSQEAFSGQVRRYASGRDDILQTVKQCSPQLNLRGKQQIVEAAFLSIHACCEIQYEDRLRLNLIANAMDVSISFVNATIEQVRQQGCYGVNRILPTQTQA